MDKETLKFYSGNSANLARKYDACEGGISAYFAEAFRPGMKILDVGCGSGRDLCELRKMGFHADGVDTCAELAKIANNITIKEFRTMEFEIPTVNRSCMIVNLKQPFVEWLNILEERDREHNSTKDEINTDNTVYLIPEYMTDEDREEVIQALYEEVFLNELAAWWTNRDDWPEITRKRFDEWFELEFYSVIHDLSPLALLHED